MEVIVYLDMPNPDSWQLLWQKLRVNGVSSLPVSGELDESVKIGSGVEAIRHYEDDNLTFEICFNGHVVKLNVFVPWDTFLSSADARAIVFGTVHELASLLHSTHAIYIPNQYDWGKLCMKQFDSDRDLPSMIHDLQQYGFKDILQFDGSDKQDFFLEKLPKAL